MKKTFPKLTVLILLLLITLTIGCGVQEEPAASAKQLDVAGEYSGTMTFTKVEVVYDSDDEGNYYKPDDVSEWVGESVEISYNVTLDGDKMTLTPTGDAEGGIVFSGDYRTDSNEFVYTMPGEEGFDDTVLSLKFYEEDNSIKGKGTIVQTHTETGWVNEIALEITRTES